MLHRSFSLLLTFLGAMPLLAEDISAPKAEHVILVVWDGMRPDFINAQNSPNLEALRQRGTFFANQHAFWPSTTEVNGTVLATGVFPSRSTIIANREYRPEINPRGPVPTEAEETVRRGDELTGGHYLGAPTVAEIARRAGLATAISGTKPVALLHDRGVVRPPAPRSAIIYAGKTIPSSLLAPITEALGAFPPYAPNFAKPAPNTEGNRWTTRALLEHLWKDGVPPYSVLWLSDPDFPQHLTSPGSPAALAGIHDSDANLGAVVAELERRRELEKSDIFVVSDHGFSTIGSSVDSVAYYREHGVDVARQFTAPPKPGEVMAVGVGGAAFLYVVGHDPAVIGRLVNLLEESDFAGPIFTRDALPGTFALGTAHLDSPGAPDIAYSFRWNSGVNGNGVAGLIAADGKAGAGMHGALSKYDIHNTLVAAGPDLRVGFRDELPTGNIDVAPTILHLLKLPDAGVDGRVLAEALSAGVEPAEKPVTQRREATREIGNGGTAQGARTWRQYLQVTTFANHSYIDEGNAGVSSP